MPNLPFRTKGSHEEHAGAKQRRSGTADEETILTMESVVVFTTYLHGDLALVSPRAAQ
jgi:hypothetical protein